jgi:hemolysin activation/secretion protein
MSYQITGSPDFQKLVEHSVSYVIPVPALRHTLSLFAFYADSRPVVPDFDINGRTWQTSLRYSIPLPARGTLTNDFTAGFDFKRSNSNLFFGGEQIFKQKNDVLQAVATYKLDRVDGHGSTHAEISLTASPGGITEFNHTSDYRAARTYAHADYAYARLELDRTTKLPAGFSWVVRGTGQIASANLLSSEQLGFGGYQSLRGFDEYQVTKDNGIIMENELHGPSFSVIRNFGGRVALADKLDPLVFIDYGIGGNHERLTAEPTNTQMASFGVGLRYMVATNLNIRFDYGWQVQGYQNSTSTGDHQRGHVGVVLAY